MKCPYCDQEMIAGYIQSQRKVYFTREKRRLLPSGGDTVLTRHNLMLPIARAYQCGACRKVIVDYEADTD